MNLTDIDDKTIKGSQKQGIPLRQFTDFYVKAFFEDIKALNIEPADVYPKATDHIPEMVNIIKALLAKGATKEELEHVHSPIGIAIGAQTPEEIAVSIMAELISERQRMQM